MENMFRLFRGYYRPSPDEFAKMWREGNFVFDTNVLLNTYRYTPNTRDDLFGVWEKLRNRIWLPHQVILEYFENRELVISQQYSLHIEIEKSLDKALEGVLNKYKKGHPFADIEAIKKIFEKTKEEIKDILQKAQANSHNLQEHDILLERITQLFDDKIGEPYSDDRLADVHNKLDARYQRNIPPGYKDAKKENLKLNDEELNIDRYGDGVIWFQIIEYAKLQKKPIIFITDDIKEDWWRRERGKTLGPRPELVKEIYDEASVPFYMYTADNFIKRAQEFLDVQVQLATIEEVRELRQQDEAMQKEAQIVDGGYYTGTELKAYQQLIDSTRRLEHILGRPSAVEMLKQHQETTRIINSLSGNSVLRKLAEDAQRTQQLFNSLGITGSFSSNSISEETNTNSSDTTDNEANQDISSDEQ